MPACQLKGFLQEFSMFLMTRMKIMNRVNVAFKKETFSGIFFEIRSHSVTEV